MENSAQSPAGQKSGHVWAIAVLCLSLNLTVLAAGCASESKRVYTTTRAEGLASDSSSQPVVVEKETHTTHVRHESQGVLSTTVHVIGEILALPFRLIGGLLRLIF